MHDWKFVETEERERNRGTSFKMASMWKGKGSIENSVFTEFISSYHG